MTERPIFDVVLPANQDVIAAPTPRMTLAEQGEAEVTKILTTKPQKFTVSGFTDGKGAVGKLTYSRKWSNGWGATAYAKAWWNDASVTPERGTGVAVGAEGSYQFGDP